MIILTIRTDKPEAEIALFDDATVLTQERWTAHRELGTTIHTKIRSLLQSQSKDWADVGGIVAFRGPGSFTGLRIGLSVANALAYAQADKGLPIVAADGDNWQMAGLKRLLAGKTDRIALPEYGAEATITQPRK